MKEKRKRKEVCAGMGHAARRALALPRLALLGLDYSPSLLSTLEEGREVDWMRRGVRFGTHVSARWNRVSHW